MKARQSLFMGFLLAIGVFLLLLAQGSNSIVAIAPAEQEQIQDAVRFDKTNANCLGRSGALFDYTAY